MPSLYGWPAPPNGPNGITLRVKPVADAITLTGKSSAQLHALRQAGEIVHTPPGQAPSGYIFYTYKWPPGSAKLKEAPLAGPNYVHQPAPAAPAPAKKAKKPAANSANKAAPKSAPKPKKKPGSKKK